MYNYLASWYYFKDTIYLYPILWILQEETYLYDPNLLLKLDFHRSPANFKPFISAANPGEPWMKVRPLKDTDYDRGFLQLLSQLTHVGNVNRTQFLSESWLSVRNVVFVLTISIFSSPLFADESQRGLLCHRHWGHSQEWDYWSCILGDRAQVHSQLCCGKLRRWEKDPWFSLTYDSFFSVAV